ncbi:MAG: hypothetical protein AAFX08_01780 [Pseudomonadota bacterium]
MGRFEYAASQISAVWKMARNDPDWREDLDASVDGVFRSFEAAFYAIPLSVILFAFFLRAAANAEEPPSAPLFSASPAIFIGVQTVAYIAEWAAGVTLLAIAARSLNASRSAAPLIASYNWAQPPITALQTVTMGGIAITGASASSVAIAFASIILQMIILWGVVRRALECDIGVTVAILAGLLVSSILAASLVVNLGAALFTG